MSYRRSYTPMNIRPSGNTFDTQHTQKSLWRTTEKPRDANQKKCSPDFHEFIYWKQQQGHVAKSYMNGYFSDIFLLIFIYFMNGNNEILHKKIGDYIRSTNSFRFTVHVHRPSYNKRTISIRIEYS